MPCRNTDRLHAVCIVQVPAEHDAPAGDGTAVGVHVGGAVLPGHLVARVPPLPHGPQHGRHGQPVQHRHAEDLRRVLGALPPGVPLAPGHWPPVSAHTQTHLRHTPLPLAPRSSPHTLSY